LSVARSVARSVVRSVAVGVGLLHAANLLDAVDDESANPPISQSAALAGELGVAAGGGL